MDGAHGAGTPELEVRLLGPIEVERDGEPAALGGQKPRTLFAVLALEPGRVVSVDRLVEALWPGEPPDTAGHAIQVYVSQLRKALGPVITTRAPGYVLELDPERVDAHRFTRLAHEGGAALEGGEPEAAEVALREALALWRGPALADFLYEPFAQTQIARLEELRTVVVEERIEADLALGRHVELVSELEALVQVERLRERPRAQLMLALYRSGRQADALAAYRDARETLVEELGIDPGPELRELEAAILRQDESLLLEETPLARPAMQFRRLVTILFVDVVESMALAEALDPEALAAVLRRYFETVSAAISHHGGIVEKYAGDAVMAAFGIPVSHEDDALRAARAALDVKAGVTALNEELVRQHGIGLEIRIGLEAGEVVATPTEARQRLVTGEAVGIASRLEQAAGTDEIVVGEVAGRLIDHAATLDPLGELVIKGKRDPVHAYRLLGLTPVAPAFEARQDAPLVGRKRELAALRRALKRATDGGSTQVAVVIGSPGVGKSRLSAELARRTRGVTTLWSRCLSYGDGITYWPLREVVAQVPTSAERDAVVAALDAETPPPGPEIALLFRRLCEALARGQPLILVVDDVHWAEPTFLELIEHVAEKGRAPILILCVAREELLEERAEFLAGRANAAQIVMEPLTAEETDVLLDGLGGTVLESDQRERIVATAEGNPFFLEQLLALALEGGLADRGLPETVQALLAARLDRLGPGERAVLERGAVVGKEFSAADVVALLDAAAAPTADAHLRTLAERGFVRPRGEASFTFRHVLVQEAVYRAAPKRLRAELHERFADRLDETSPDLSELDEFVGYHLEQAYQLRADIGESDRRAKQLAENAGRRLGAAGNRAWRRNDEFASVNLLGRATALLEPGDEMRRDLLCELAISLTATEDLEAAERVATDAVTTSESAGDLRREMRARLELAVIHLVRDQTTGADDLLDVATHAMAVFETARDHRAMGRTWLLIGYVRGSLGSRHGERQEAAERALVEYRASNLSTSSCLGEIAASLYYGPEPVLDAISRCEQLQEDDLAGLVGRANVLVYQGGLEGQRGRFEQARILIDEAQRTYEDLGQLVAVSGRCRPVLADVELLAGAPLEAEAVLRDACVALERAGDRRMLSNRAADLADVLLVLGRVEEAAEWLGVAMPQAATLPTPATVRGLGVRAKIAAHRGDDDDAVAWAREAVSVAEQSDALNLQGRAYATLARVLHALGRHAEASESADMAVGAFVQKGNVSALAEVKELAAPTVGA